MNPKEYKWEKWFEDGRMEFKRGVHFRCSTSSFIQQARNWATKLGYKISVKETDKCVTLLTTEYPPRDRARAKTYA